MAPATPKTARHVTFIPLWDRLVDGSDEADPRGEEPEPLRSMTESELRASIQGTLTDLLNTRVAVRVEEIASAPRTVVNYGLPDFSHLTLSDSSDRRLLAMWVTAAIEAYEPRLQRVRVEVEPSPSPASHRVCVDIHAFLTLDERPIPINFPVLLMADGERAP